MIKGLLILAVCAGSLHAQMTVTLTASSSQVPVGTAIGWTAVVNGIVGPSGSTPPMLWYRYRVRLIGENYTVIRDFGPNESLLWAASAREGT